MASMFSLGPRRKPLFFFDEFTWRVHLGLEMLSLHEVEMIFVSILRLLFEAKISFSKADGRC